MSDFIRPWLAEIPWDLVEFQNAALCEAKNALHKPTSDGYSVTRALWEANHQNTMSLYEVIELCRRCHRIAPFCFYNGNTFAAIARSLIQLLELSSTQSAVVRSLAGHIVAGVATDEEVKAFKAFCQSS